MLLAVLGPAAAETVELVQNPGMEETAALGVPTHYTLTGAAIPGRVGRIDEITTHGVIFPGKAKGGGSVSQIITGIDPKKGRWLTFRFRGLAEDRFTVDNDALAMKIEFFSKGGTESLDGVTRMIYREVEKDRSRLTVNGNFQQHGAEVWRTYELEELIPFPEVDTVKVSVIYNFGSAVVPQHTDFFIDDFSLVQRTESLTGKVDPASNRPVPPPGTAPDVSHLTPLGGRWYYRFLSGEKTTMPLVVTATNADRLFYRADRLTNPFANTMTAWMRPGQKDAQGHILTEDRFIPDNVVLTFNGDGFVNVLTHNIPDHPTAKFPDTFGTQGYNRSYIQEIIRTYRLPLEPVLNPEAKAVDATNSNYALPMGSIGFAVNGVSFYNPFDALMTDASNIMDRCCGHPSQDNRYHYHKYPVCVNTPFVDEGEEHSPLIGFAFDGLPVYGPYEEKGVMARDDQKNPLNAFNAHYDPVRGWHYHVTPGKFPYIIGGYYGKIELSNFDHPPDKRPPPPPGMGGTPPRQSD